MERRVAKGGRRRGKKSSSSTAASSTSPAAFTNTQNAFGVPPSPATSAWAASPAAALLNTGATLLPVKKEETLEVCTATCVAGVLAALSANFLVCARTHPIEPATMLGLQRTFLLI